MADAPFYLTRDAAERAAHDTYGREWWRIARVVPYLDGYVIEETM